LRLEFLEIPVGRPAIIQFEGEIHPVHPRSGAFIVLAYNLSQLLHEKVKEDQSNDGPAHPHRDRASEKKWEKRLKDLKQKTADRGHDPCCRHKVARLLRRMRFHLDL
jgi:hypothetical protein